MTTAQQSYDTLAPGYDHLTANNNYELWLGEILLPEMEKHGLRKGRALDAGCGTGRAFEPLLRRGWEVRGCDLSPAMLAVAQRRFPAVPVFTADLCHLPTLGRFDLVLALNDVVNYLTGDGDLERALAGMRANLAAGGFVLFDSNTLATFRDCYSPDAEPGGTYTTTFEAEGVEPHPHRQRHFTEAQLQDAMTAADLEVLVVLGQREERDQVILSETVDQERDEKIVCIARLAPTGLRPPRCLSRYGYDL